MDYELEKIGLKDFYLFERISINPQEQIDYTEGVIIWAGHYFRVPQGGMIRKEVDKFKCWTEQDFILFIREQKREPHLVWYNDSIQRGTKERILRGFGVEHEGGLKDHPIIIALQERRIIGFRVN